MATNTTKIPRKQRRLRPTRGRRQQSRRSVSVSLAYVQKQLGRGRITERDQALMFLLHDCFVLSHDQIKRLYWPGVRSSSCRRRLRQLYDMHFLDRAMDVSPQMEKLGLAPGIAYTLGKAGHLWLEKLNEREKAPDYPLANAARLLHDLGLAEIMVCLTEAMRGRGVALIWQGENEARVVAEVAEGKTGRVLLEPDAMMTLHYVRQGEEAVASFFVEWDMGSERGQHFRKKVQGYDGVRRREKLWQDKGLTRFPAVALVTTSERRAGNLVERIKDTRQTEVLWLVTDVAALRGAPLGEIWRVILQDGRVLESQPLLPGV
jgi:hypothetical protein